MVIEQERGIIATIVKNDREAAFVQDVETISWGRQQVAESVSIGVHTEEFSDDLVDAITIDARRSEPTESLEKALKDLGL